MSLTQRLHALDLHQQRIPGLRFIAAVFKKFSDDGASQLAALIAYYGFFALFPLLLVFVTVLGFVLQGNASAQESVLHSTLSEFPVIGTQLQNNVHSLKGSGLALAIGIIGSLLAGLGITGATQSAFNQVWYIPHKRRPNFLTWRLRGLGLLTVLGLLSILSSVVTGYASSGSSGLVGAIGGVLVALIFNLLLFFAAFRLLTSDEIQTVDLIPGVLVAAVLWQILQYVGGIYVEHVIRHAKETSGLFAFVLGLLAWLYLGAQVLLVAAEINVVKAKKLWPRSFLSDPLLEADRRALTAAAEVQERIDEQNVEVSFDEPA